MQLISIAAAAVFVLASFGEAAPTSPHKLQARQQAAGLNKIKHVVYFMQVSELIRECALQILIIIAIINRKIALLTTIMVPCMVFVVSLTLM